MILYLFHVLVIVLDYSVLIDICKQSYIQHVCIKIAKNIVICSYDVLGLGKFSFAN